MNKKGAIVIDMPTTCFECRFCHESSYDNRYKICGDNFVELNIWKLMNIANCVLSQISVR